MARDRQYHVHLTEKEREIVKHFRKKASCITQRKHFDVILNANEGKYGRNSSYGSIAAKAGVSVTAATKVLRTFCNEGLERATTLERNPASDVARLKAKGMLKPKSLPKPAQILRMGGSNGQTICWLKPPRLF
jgi:hypothetical protein